MRYACETGRRGLADMGGVRREVEGTGAVQFLGRADMAIVVAEKKDCARSGYCLGLLLLPDAASHLVWQIAVSC